MQINFAIRKIRPTFVEKIYRIMQDSKELIKAIAHWNTILPLSENDKALLDRKFVIDFNYNSNHIEGNTLTYGQTELLLLFGKVITESEMKDLEEMKAHNIGLKLMQSEADEIRKPLTETFIRQLHKILIRDDYTISCTLSCGHPSEFTIHAGCYKTRPNSVITRYGDRFEYASPEETPALMNDLVAWYNEVEHTGEYTPIQLAALFHYRYIRIHPFEDGNGRIARLMVNYILARHNFPMIVVRSRKKQAYLEALHKTDIAVGVTPSIGAHASLQKINHFLRYFERLAAEEIENQISFLSEHDENIWWFDGEKVSFRSANTTKLLRILMREPDTTINELVQQLGINRSAVQKQLDILQRKGYIIRGNGYDGKWHVVIVASD